MITNGTLRNTSVSEAFVIFHLRALDAEREGGPRDFVQNRVVSVAGRNHLRIQQEGERV